MKLHRGSMFMRLNNHILAGVIVIASYMSASYLHAAADDVLMITGEERLRAIKASLQSVPLDQRLSFVTGRLEQALAARDVLYLRTLIHELRHHNDLEPSPDIRQIYYDILQEWQAFHLGLRVVVIEAILRRNTPDKYDLDNTLILLSSGHWGALQFLIKWDHCGFRDRVQSMASSFISHNHDVFVTIYPERIQSGGEYDSPRDPASIPSHQQVYLSDLLVTYLAMCGDQSALNYLLSAHRDAELPKMGEMRQPSVKDKTYWYCLLYIIGHAPEGAEPEIHWVL